MRTEFEEIYNVKDYKLKSKIYIPTYKHRPNTIIDEVKDWDNVVIMTDQEDYDENYKDFPIEKTWIVPRECRSLHAKRKLCAEVSKKNNEWYFMLDDDIWNFARIYDYKNNCPKNIDLYEALKIWEKYAMANDIFVSSPGLNIVVAYFNEKTNMLSKPHSTLNGCFLIDSSKIDPEWCITDPNISEDCVFTYNCLMNGVDTRRVQFFSVKFKNVAMSKSLILNNEKKKLKNIVDTFLECKGVYCMKMTKNGDLLTLYDGKSYLKEYLLFTEWKQKYPNDYPDKVLEYYKEKNARRV